MGQVLLNIRGTQTQNGESEQVEFTTQGTLDKEQDRYILSYLDTQTLGEGSLVRTIISADAGSVVLQRQGELDTQKVFEQSKTYTTAYETPFGKLDLFLFPTMVQTHLADEKGSIELEYVMSIAGTQIVNRLMVDYVADAAQTTMWEV